MTFCVPQLPVSQGSAQKGAEETSLLWRSFHPSICGDGVEVFGKEEDFWASKGDGLMANSRDFSCFLPRSVGHKSPSPAHRSLRATEPPIALPLPGEPAAWQLFQDHPRASIFREMLAPKSLSRTDGLPPLLPPSRLLQKAEDKSPQC